MTIRETIAPAMIREAAAYLSPRMEDAPRIGVISGTGLERLCDLIKNQRRFPVGGVPNFPLIGPTDRMLIAGTMGGLPAILLTKRLHVYEGFSMAQIAFIVRLFKELGVKILVLTNAAGGLNPHFTAGQIMLITDHINLLGGSPLEGTNLDEYGERFPDMSEPYDSRLIESMEKAARILKIPLLKGVYAAVRGPNLETRAETRFLKSIGADAVGMSTVPEVIAARHCSMRTAGLSVLSNVNLPDCPVVHTLEGIVEAVKGASATLMELIEGFLALLPEEELI